MEKSKMCPYGFHSNKDSECDCGNKVEKSKELPKGTCPSCWGKKYNSVMNRETAMGDFIGDKDYDSGSHIDNTPCSKCNGTGKDNIESNYKADDYETNFSHYHCWDNKDNPCGIPLEKHTQCCLCEKLPHQTEEVEDWETTDNARRLGMCWDKCDCGHCNLRRQIINEIISSNTERVKKIIENEPDCYIDEDGDEDIMSASIFKENIINNIK